MWSKSTILVFSIVILSLIMILVLFNEYYQEQHIFAEKPKIKSMSISYNNVQTKKISQLSMMVDNLMNKLKLFDIRYKVDKDYEEYKKQRDQIVSTLPGLTNNTYQTTFHVLVDYVPKKCSNRYKVIVLISSNAPNFDRRQTIRNMWGKKSNWKNQMWQVFFITGGHSDKNVMKKLYNEAKETKDLIIEDVPESFYHMSQKVMIALQWAHVNFKYDYIFKCDDDVFVHMDHLTSRLKKYKEHTYFGQAMLGQPVERQGRYGVTKEEHLAGGFVMSHDTIQGIIPLFNWEKPLKIDDAYFGGLAYKYGSVAKQGEGFYMWNANCQYHDDVIIIHPAKERKCMTSLQTMARSKQ